MTTSAQSKLASICTALFLGSVCEGQEIINYYPSDYGGGPNIYSITKDPQGLLYFANSKGILVFNGSVWQLVELKNFSEGRTVKTDKDGRVYASGIGEFGYLLKDQLGNPSYYSISEGITTETNYQEGWQIIFHQGLIYFQTYEGISSWSPVDGAFATLSLSDSYIFSGFGDLFASQFGNGLGVVRKGEFKLIAPIGDDDAAFQFFPISETRIVVPTASSGFFELTRSKAGGLYDLAPLNTNIDSTIIASGFYDGIRLDENLFALGTWEGGVLLYDFDTHWHRQIDQGDGLISNQINDLEVGPLGDLWMGTQMGISVIDLDSIIPPPVMKAQTIISRIVVNQDSVLFSGNHANPLADQEIEPLIQDKENSIFITFSTPGFNSKAQNQYKIFLEGYDSDWSQWVSRPEKEYTNLDQGFYTFRVKSLLPNGSESSPAKLDFEIRYVWYQTMWAYLGLSLIAALVIAIGVKRYTAQLARSKNKLEKLVEDRTAELSGQQAKLKQINEDLTRINDELDQFVYRSSHDLIAPVKSLKGLVSLAQMDPSDQSLQKYLTMVNEQILKLEEFISYVLNYSANTKQDVGYQPIDFSEIISRSRDKLKFYEKASDIRIECTIDHNGDFRSDPHRLRFIVDNLLSNAIKYYRRDQPNPKIQIEVKHGQDGVEISFTDNGIGIEPQHQSRIFDMFYRRTDQSHGSGLGLYIAREAARKLDGDIVVDSEVSKGSTFLVTIPNRTDDAS